MKSELSLLAASVEPEVTPKFSALLENYGHSKNGLTYILFSYPNPTDGEQRTRFAGKDGNGEFFALEMEGRHSELPADLNLKHSKKTAFVAWNYLQDAYEKYCLFHEYEHDDHDDGAALVIPPRGDQALCNDLQKGTNSLNVRLIKALDTIIPFPSTDAQQSAVTLLNNGQKYIISKYLRADISYGFGASSGYDPVTIIAQLANLDRTKRLD